MHRVQAYIDEHLPEPLDLARIARVAHFSDYHFHRLFAAWMGETLGDYLRRRRLEVAAQRLVAQPGLPVLSAALSVGWGSGEAFARAFKARFGAAPSVWREQFRKHDQALRNPDQAPRAGDADDGLPFDPLQDSPMTTPVRLIDRPATRIAYRRHIGPYGPPIHAFWMKEVAPWIRREQLFGQPRYGISHDDPSIVDPNKCRYDAAVEVDDAYMPTPGVFVATLPAGRYASMPFFGDSVDVNRAWQTLLRDWLPASGLQLDARPCFEHYAPGARYDAATGRFACDIVIPVAPL